MRIGYPRIGLVVLSLVCTPALSGCQWFGGGKADLASSGLTREIAETFGEDQLAAGKAALAERRTSEAIDFFMVARLYPEHAAEAYNGLGVAYSQLGRSDLTEKFFQTAIALAPGDERFRSNLALLYERQGMSRTARIDVGLLPPAAPFRTSTAHGSEVEETADQPRVAAVSLANGVVALAPESRLRRTSPRQVVVESPAGDAGAVRPDRSPQVRPPRLAQRPSYPVRIVLPTTAPSVRAAGLRPVAAGNRHYPIRLVLPEAQDVQVSEESRRSAPQATKG